MATLSDVAAAASVSASVASRVLSNAPETRVRPETRERIQKAARDLGYRPNFAGRALKLARSNAIALIVPDLTNVTELMNGVEDGALARDYIVLLGRAEAMQPGGEAIDKLIGEGRVDGMLVQLSENIAPEHVQTLLEYSAPVVFINSIEDDHIGSVSLADELGTKIAVDHVLELGHRRIGFIGGSASSYSAQRRERGFRTALGTAGIPVEESYVTSFGYAPESGHAALRALMDLPVPPTAVVAANVNAAIGALAEARAVGVRVPEELSVVAFNDSWTAEHTWPPLTTVKMPMYELGRRAFEVLYARLHGEEVGDVVVESPAPRLIRRGSAQEFAKH